jgi:hypothetical protein
MHVVEDLKNLGQTRSDKLAIANMIATSGLAPADSADHALLHLADPSTNTAMSI